MPLQRFSNYSTCLGIPDSNRVVQRSRDDVPTIRRVGNGIHSAGMPLERLTACNTSLSIPDPNGLVIGSGNDLPPIGGIAYASNIAGMPSP
jgi:hypothetical protein